LTSVAIVAARFAVVLIFCGVMFLVISQSAASPAKSRAEAQITALETQIDAARKRNAVLAERLEYRKSGGFVLATAKRELMLVEPGEINLELDGVLPVDSPSPSLPDPVAVEARHVPGLLDFGYIRAWRDALFNQP
jgi:cell division protein FtsB